MKTTNQEKSERANRSFRGHRSWRLGLAAVLCLAGLVPAAFAEKSPEQSMELIENTRSALEKWVETRRVISQEKHDFALAKEMLNERIALVEREIASLKEKITDAEKSITEADKKRADLLEENEKLKAASASLGETVITLESRTRALLTKLPDPIRERVKPLSQRFPENPQETKLSLSERFQNIIGVLNEIDKFNREISVTSEVRELPGGNSAEVTAMYVGISQGYYANANGDIGGTGRTGPAGWTWTPNNAEAANIKEAIAILKNEKPAAFISLPVEVE